MIPAIRGAITVEHNEAEEILTATERLVKRIANDNGIYPADIVSVLISTTADINACFQAAAWKALLITGDVCKRNRCTECFAEVYSCDNDSHDKTVAA